MKQSRSHIQNLSMIHNDDESDENDFRKDEIDDYDCKTSQTSHRE